MILFIIIYIISAPLILCEMAFVKLGIMDDTPVTSVYAMPHSIVLSPLLIITYIIFTIWMKKKGYSLGTPLGLILALNFVSFALLLVLTMS